MLSELRQYSFQDSRDPQTPARRCCQNEATLRFNPHDTQHFLLSYAFRIKAIFVSILTRPNIPALRYCQKQGILCFNPYETQKFLLSESRQSLFLTHFQLQYQACQNCISTVWVCLILCCTLEKSQSPRTVRCCILKRRSRQSRSSLFSLALSLSPTFFLSGNALLLNQYSRSSGHSQ